MILYSSLSIIMSLSTLNRDSNCVYLKQKYIIDIWNKIKIKTEVDLNDWI